MSALVPVQPSFVTVSTLKPGTEGHNLLVKVVQKVPVVDRKKSDGTTVKIALAILGDSTASIVFTARDDQCDLLKEGDSLEVRNGRIEMFDKGFMRLEVDPKWGKILKAQTPVTEVNSKNMSVVEYELVPSAENTENQ